MLNTHCCTLGCRKVKENMRLFLVLLNKYPSFPILNTMQICLLGYVVSVGLCV